MKEIEAYDCFTKLHFSDERTVQSPWQRKREM
jgi:hypothetical protein